MFCQMVKEHALAHSGWVVDRDPPRTGSFLVSIVDPDNWRYTTISVWQEGRWDMLYGKVLGWQEKPEPIRV